MEETIGIKCPPWVIVMIDGGLGSQMGQYTLGLSVARNSTMTVKHDLSWYRTCAKDCQGIENRFFALTKIFPNVKISLPPEKLRLFFARYLNAYPGIHLDFEPEILSPTTPCYLGGYYCHPRYALDALEEARSVFAFTPQLDARNEEMLRQIRATEFSVAIHVRRGDYVGTNFDVCTEAYFSRAIDIIAAKLSPHEPTFFVFSNGMEWTRKLFAKFPHKFVFVEGNDSDHVQFDLFLMTQCGHFILSNSSLSFWGGFLSQRAANKAVIIPESWSLSASHAAGVAQSKALCENMGWMACPTR